MRYTNGLRGLDNTRNVYAHGVMGTPPAGSLRDVYLESAHSAKGPLPIFPLPRHLIQEKTLWVDIFHTLRVIFLADWAAIHQSYSRMALSAAFSFHNRGQMVLCKTWATNPTAETARYCLTSYSQHKQWWRRPHVAQGKESDSLVCRWKGFFFSSL